MTLIQEVRIIAIEGLEIPDNITQGSEFTITATLYVSEVDQDWVDVTLIAGKPERLPGNVTVSTVAREWQAR